MIPDPPKPPTERWTRRQFLTGAAAGGAAVVGGGALYLNRKTVPGAEVFVARAADYSVDFKSIILSGFNELGVTPAEIRGKRILLKPNLVEVHRGSEHINTHPAVVRGAVEAFLSWGAAKVWVGEGPGHQRDTDLILDESGLGEVLVEDRIAFVDLNYAESVGVPNLGDHTPLRRLILPTIVREVDWIVSLAKMKTHHWAGATLSMKNMFGIMPGRYYGWPKNVLHHVGVPEAILDINATVKPSFGIVDGTVGMEGDGPIMGTPRAAGVIAMGRSLPSLDATCCRVMGIDPLRIPYLKTATRRLGVMDARRIEQRGERPASVRQDFQLIEKIPAQRDLRLA